MQEFDTRPRTATRMRYVGAPGMEVGEFKNLKTIGRYEIMETLGKGAMGIVYKARDPLLDRIVAVKTIVSPKGNGRSNRRAFLERFEREAKAAAKMQHPAIVTIFDVGSDDNAPFMVLEYLPGDSLADRLDKVRIPLGRGVQTAIDLAGALGFAHKERIIHRDVKPANVLNAGDNRWKLADFGIARMPDSDLTQVGIFMGTPGYAPPEAISQGRYTPQADVFAWGAVLYELLSGRIPYEGPDTRTTNGYVLKKTARSPREHDASIPEVIANVCMTALHSSIDVRYKDGAEAQRALQAAWERCLNEELVGPRAFSAKEIPHDSAPALMHGTADTEGNHIAAPIVIGDNDPTRVRDQRPASLASTFGLGSGRGHSAPELGAETVETVETVETRTETGTTPSLQYGAPPTVGLWAGLAVSGMMACGFALYYLL